MICVSASGRYSAVDSSLLFLVSWGDSTRGSDHARLLLIMLIINTCTMRRVCYHHILATAQPPPPPLEYIRAHRWHQTHSSHAPPCRRRTDSISPYACCPDSPCRRNESIIVLQHWVLKCAFHPHFLRLFEILNAIL
jgi:hypothetical protein